MSEIPSRVISCVTHHYACDCREYFQHELVVKLQKENEILREAVELVSGKPWASFNCQDFTDAALEKIKALNKKEG